MEFLRVEVDADMVMADQTGAQKKTVFVSGQQRSNHLVDQLLRCEGFIFFEMPALNQFGQRQAEAKLVVLQAQIFIQVFKDHQFAFLVQDEQIEQAEQDAKQLPKMQCHVSNQEYF